MVNENEKIGILVKTTMVDYPGHIASAIFLKGCNMRCDYCQNKELVKEKIDNLPEAVTLKELYDHLEKYKEKKNYLVISGGEPLINKNTDFIIKFAKKIGYKIKLDTNLTRHYLTGMFHILTNVDYIAIDFKTSIDNMKAVTSSHSQIGSFELNIENLKNLAKFKELMKNEKRRQELLDKTYNFYSLLIDKEFEFRTTLYPEYFPIKKGEEIPENLLKIARDIPINTKWFLQQFYPRNCISDKANNVSPFKNEDIEKWFNILKEKFPKIEIGLRNL